MIITKSNILANLTPVVTGGASSDDPKNIVNPDFSVNYTSSSLSSLIVTFGSTQAINYVAIAGIRLANTSTGTISILNGATVISSGVINRNNVFVANFEAQAFSSLKVVLQNNSFDQQPIVSYIAAGLALTVPNNGETGGHGRSWLDRGQSLKTTTNDLSAPVAVLRKPTALNGSLKVPNAPTVFSEGEWQDFLDFSASNLFFINEDPLKPQASYCCYDVSSTKATAHNSTRSLNNLSINFKVFNGL